MPGSEWSKDQEREKWDKRVDVCFQENAWVDSQTNIHSLERTALCVNKWLEDNSLTAIQFEDNLGNMIAFLHVVTQINLLTCD